MEENKEEMNDSILYLEKKLDSLKHKLESSKEKEKLYESSIMEIRKINKDYEESFLMTYNNYKNKENTLKIEYDNYKKKIEEKSNELEKNLLEEKLKIKKEINERCENIRKIKENNKIIKNKINQNEIEYYFKEKNYEEKLFYLDNEINQITETSTQIAKDANQQIQKLVDEVNDIKNNFDNFNYENNNYNILSPQEKINFLEIENNILKDKIKKKEEEINFLKSYERIPLNNNTNQNNVYENRIKELEKNLENYGSIILNLKETYNNSIINHKNEMDKLKNFYENKNITSRNINNINISNISGSIQGNNNFVVTSSSEKNGINSFIVNSNDDNNKNNLIKEIKNDEIK